MEVERIVQNLTLSSVKDAILAARLCTFVLLFLNGALLVDNYMLSSPLEGEQRYDRFPAGESKDTSESEEPKDLEPVRNDDDSSDDEDEDSVDEDDDEDDDDDDLYDLNEGDNEDSDSDGELESDDDDDEDGDDDEDDSDDEEEDSDDEDDD